MIGVLPGGLLEFSNRFTRELPADPITENRARQVSESAYSRVSPTPVRAPRILALNKPLALQLGLDDVDSESLAQLLSGNELLPGMDPFAMAYGGHQFGNWAGQLGDGRAINLGELRNAAGEYFTLQLKGAGPTPYSRHADGRAVLRSSLREYLCSEAMHALGVATTRALSLVLSGDEVVRDMFYDGNPQAEPGAIVCRVAPSFVRFGSFELPAARGDLTLLRQLMTFCIRSDWPDLAARLTHNASKSQHKAVYLEWFSRVCELTQQMIVQWMRVGFVHGVMNTDNMSVLGLTLDYGPYGWVDDYDPDWTPNTTDAGGRRYRFGQQAAVARWNLYQLANAIYPLVEDAPALQAILEALPARYEASYHQMMCAKLGIKPNDEKASWLAQSLPALLSCQPTDMTLFFRNISRFDPLSADAELQHCVAEAFYDEAGLRESNQLRYREWQQAYRDCLLRDCPLQNTESAQTRVMQMNAVNPLYVPRNYLAQQAIEALTAGDDTLFSQLLRTLERPYEDQGELARQFAQKRPSWALNKAGSSMLSCSS